MSDKEFVSDFPSRLRAALDRVSPPTPDPKAARFYRATAARPGLGRLKLAIALAAAISLVAVAATAASGSANPAVWTQRALTTVESVTHRADAKPSSHQPGSTANPEAGESPGPAGASEGPGPEPSESPEPERSPEPAESPEPSGSHDGGDGGYEPGSAPGSDG